MIGNVQDVYCDKCNRYLFTETDTEDGCKRENDNKDYDYDEIKDIFVCNKCKGTENI